MDEGIKTAILKNEQEVIRTINMVESGNIEDAIQRIKAARRIMIFARGFSELIAQEMMSNFSLLANTVRCIPIPTSLRTSVETIKGRYRDLRFFKW